MLVTFNRAIVVGCFCLLFAAHISAQVQQGRTIRKAYIPREPVTVLEVKVGEQSVRLDTAFFDNESWLKGLQLKLKNISGKTIQYIEVEIIIPESITRGNPLVMPISYGQKQAAEVATTVPKSVSDGDSVVLVLPDAGYDSIRNFLTDKNGSTTINSIELRIGMTIFSDGTAWREGSILHRGPNNPNIWRRDDGETDY